MDALATTQTISMEFQSMAKVAEFDIRNVYGNPLIYPCNGVAESFCKLAGKKTLSVQDLEVIEEIGIKVTVFGPSGVVYNAQSVGNVLNGSRF